MTNIALLAMRAPDRLERVREIVVMGGSSRERGNITPAAEFNIFADAEAAARVLACGRPVTMFGLDVTYKVLARAEHRARLEASSSAAARLLAPILSPLPDWTDEQFGSDVVPLNDPCTVAWLLRPELFKLRQVNVEIETGSTLTYGETVVDFWSYSGRRPNVGWAYEVDSEGVMDLIMSRIAALP